MSAVWDMFIELLGVASGLVLVDDATKGRAGTAVITLV